MKFFGYRIRVAIIDDVMVLPQIEREAAKLFAGFGVELGDAMVGPAVVNTIDTFSEAVRSGHLWVATDRNNRPVGFALMAIFDGNAHLEELGVLPEHGRKGIGSELVEAVCLSAAEMDFRCVTLSTFRDVPWNKAFYEKLGFIVLRSDEYTQGLRELVEVENEKGLNTSVRVLMQREIIEAPR